MSGISKSIHHLHQMLLGISRLFLSFCLGSDNVTSPYLKRFLMLSNSLELMPFLESLSNRLPTFSVLYMLLN
ncbi:Uncharacterised protein [Mycobacterium tuberculosis]|nr:Uncharacterised protein [Mycobacterium tuberculosis]